MTNTNTETGKRDTGRFVETMESDADGYVILSVYRVELHEDTYGDWNEVDVYVGGGYFDTHEEADAASATLTTGA